MTNRHERRRALKQGVVFVDYGRLLPADLNHGVAVHCYVCNAAHAASGLARIEARRSHLDVPLCEDCLMSSERGNDVVRKFLNAPEMVIEEAGEASLEQIVAVADKRDETEH